VNGGILPDSPLPAKRLDGGKKPGFVLSVSDDYFARSSTGLRFGPRLEAGPQLCWTVVVAIERDQDGTARRLPACHSHGPRQTLLIDQEATVLSNRRSDLDVPTPGRIPEAPQQDGKRFHIAVTFYDRLDLHRGKS